MIRRFVACAVAAWVAAASVWAAAPSVQLSIHDGRVWLVATDATVRQILAEWARVGQTTVVNAERVPGGPVTLHLTDVPEEQALDVLLRSVSGFVAAPRAFAASNISQFDRILILPTSAAPAASGARPAAAPAVSPPPVPVFPQPAMPTFTAGVQRVIGADGNPVPDDQDDPSEGPPSRPQFNSIPPGFPPSSGVPPPRPLTAQAPSATPTSPTGVAVPGTIVQPPPPAAQPQLPPGRE